MTELNELCICACVNKMYKYTASITFMLTFVIHFNLLKSKIVSPIHSTVAIGLQFLCIFSDIEHVSSCCGRSCKDVQSWRIKTHWKHQAVQGDFALNVRYLSGFLVVTAYLSWNRGCKKLHFVGSCAGEHAWQKPVSLKLLQPSVKKMVRGKSFICLSLFFYIIPYHILHNKILSLLSKTDIPPEEKQEIELLEQVLKKALKIRSTSEAHKELHSDSNQEKHPNESKHKALINYTVKEEDKRKPVKSSPPSETCKKPNHHRQAAGGNVTHGSVLVRKGPTGVTGRLTVPKSAPGKISSTGSQQKMRVKATNAKQSSPSISCQDGKFTTENVQSNAQWYVSDWIFIFIAAKYEMNL